MKRFERTITTDEPQSAVQRIDAQLAALGSREIEVHARRKLASTVVETDSAEREIGSIRAHRIALLTRRNQAAACELRAKAASLRKEAVAV